MTTPTHTIPKGAECHLVITDALKVAWSPKQDTPTVITGKTSNTDGHLLAVCDVALDGDLVSALVPYHLLDAAPSPQAAIHKEYDAEVESIWRDGRLNNQTRPAALDAAKARKRQRLAEVAVGVHEVATAVHDVTAEEVEGVGDVSYDDVLADRHLRAVAPCWVGEDGNVLVRSNSDRDKVYTVRLLAGVPVGCSCPARVACRHRRIAEHCNRWWAAAHALIEGGWEPEEVAAGYLNTARLFFDAAKVVERPDAMIRAAFRMIDCAGHWLPPEVLAWTGPTPSKEAAEAGRARRRKTVELPMGVAA